MLLPPKWYQFLISVFASLGSFLYGYDLGIIAEVIACSDFQERFNRPDDDETGAIVSVFTGGAFFGAAFAGPVADYFGRKKTILLGAIVFLLGGGLQTGAQNLKYLYSGRAIAGLGVGILVMIVPPYQAEVSHPSIRGRITSLQQFMLGLGALIAAWISYAEVIHYEQGDSKQWRIGLGIQNIPAGILALLIMLFPESPRWLISHGRPEDGLKTLAKLHAHGDEDDPWVRAEFEQIQESVTYDREHEAQSYLELFRDKACFRRLFLACALQASIQMTGVSAIQYYSVTIYGQLGINTENTLLYQAASSFLAIFGEFLCMLFIDYTGRRWPLIIGNLTNCLTFIIATILITQYPPGSAGNSAAQWGFIVMTWLYNFSFSSTCGPLSWIIPAEIFDTRTRSKGVSLATMVSFAFNTLIGQTTSVAMENIGWRWYILFIVCNFTNAIFFWAILPETAKRPLEEMKFLFESAPLFVPGMKKSDFENYELEHRQSEIERKASVGSDIPPEEDATENKETHV